jgi:hypothetical protein
MELTFACQFVLVMMSFYELATNDQYLPYYKQSVSIMLIFGRFICATILHLSIVDNVNCGLEIMKYTCNHSYKF